MADRRTPSIDEIMASTQVLSSPDASSTVVKVNGMFAVKYGRSVTPIEARNLEYLSTNTTLPIPKFYGSMESPSTAGLILVMEFVEGQTLDKVLPSLTVVERQDIFDQIREALIQLRSMTPPSYFGSEGYGHFADGIFYSDPVDNAKSGPFMNETELNEGMLRRLSESCTPSHLQLLRTIMESTLRDHQAVFTHADLQPKNIMVQSLDTRQDGRRVFNIKILDWEMSGWYPEYWEFCNATIWDGLHPEWLEAVQSIMKVYPQEYLMMKVIRRIIFQLG